MYGKCITKHTETVLRLTLRRPHNLRDHRTRKAEDREYARIHCRRSIHDIGVEPQVRRKVIRDRVRVVRPVHVEHKRRQEDPWEQTPVDDSDDLGLFCARIFQVRDKERVVGVRAGAERSKRADLVPC